MSVQSLGESLNKLSSNKDHSTLNDHKIHFTHRATFYLYFLITECVIQNCSVSEANYSVCRHIFFCCQKKCYFIFYLQIKRTYVILVLSEKQCYTVPIMRMLI